ncbi:uncharacterized protein LAESUDRAFT_640898 [Laetiporus sulphureus 93-53]|uniref:DUF4219 domain-containing protein n=1 Tax=Laetiporus sulphureus 93-53 TaxID=1314785 RepID=A0A165HUW4_9APHY|nr:uncharacterized protein LAESUDRAFT_640898 [Laetiporus sulphureus 93-53]KZT12221.1 hypothetical protein LAESUDRAFT_640898 [Laetiporus sulphureus 93-53]
MAEESWDTAKASHLVEDNYRLWVIKMQVVLVQKDLWEQVDIECWFKLRNTHRAKGFITELAKWWTFYYVQMQESESCQGWIARVKALVRALKEVNVEVDEIQKVLVLVMGLMDKYG